MWSDGVLLLVRIEYNEANERRCNRSTFVAQKKSPTLLLKLAERLKADAALKLRVVGHTDDAGDAAKNKALSLKRPESVKKRLVALAGCEESPLEENTSPEGRAVNRRVEITIAR